MLRHAGEFSAIDKVSVMPDFLIKQRPHFTAAKCSPAFAKRIVLWNHPSVWGDDVIEESVEPASECALCRYRILFATNCRVSGELRKYISRDERNTEANTVNNSDPGCKFHVASFIGIDIKLHGRRKGLRQAFCSRRVVEPLKVKAAFRGNDTDQRHIRSDHPANCVGSEFHVVVDEQQVRIARRVHHYRSVQITNSNDIGIGCGKQRRLNIHARKKRENPNYAGGGPGFNFVPVCGNRDKNVHIVANIAH